MKDVIILFISISALLISYTNYNNNKKINTILEQQTIQLEKYDEYLNDITNLFDNMLNDLS